MPVVFEKPSDLSDYLFRILDNGGSSADRYTVMFSDGSYLAMSSSPTHPQGVSMSGDDMDPAVAQEWVENGEAVDLALGDLPEHIVKHIIGRNNQGLEDFLAAVEAKEPYAVAPNREKAKVNEGLYDSLGVGIYDSPEGYRIRLDGDPEDDRGPFETAREAVLASLPDMHAFAGDEYHSRVDLMRMEPDEEVRKAVEALEAKVDAAWQASRGM